MRRAVLAIVVATVVGCHAPSRVTMTCPAPESLAFPLPHASLVPYGVPEPAQVPPIVYVDNFGAAGDCVTDDATAIENAISSIPTGGTVVFTPGKTYRKVGSTAVAGNGVILWGYGSVVFADAVSLPAHLGFKLSGSSDAAYGMTVITNLRTRNPAANDGAAFLLQGDLPTVIDDRCEYTEMCTHNTGGTNSVVGRNVAYRTQADSFGALDCAVGNPCTTKNSIVVWNTSRQGGDDGVSVDDFGGPGPSHMTDFLIEHNDIADLYGGRGVAVLGASNITIRANTIDDIGYAAGILLSSNEVVSPPRNFGDVDNILVPDNSISNIQTEAPPYDPIGGTHTLNQGGLLSFAPQVGHHVTHVQYTGNHVTDTLYATVGFNGAGVCTQGLQGLRAIFPMNQITIQIFGSVPAACVGCADNQLVDDSSQTAAACTATMPVVTGSSYTHR